jgi:MEMO1 family protein
VASGEGSARVRPPAVAGQFYTADPNKLRAEVAGLLARASIPPMPQPKALIAPHAGYIYSGAVAAAAFATLGRLERRIERVVLLGPAHYVPLRGIAAPTADAFATPLGRVAVDQEALGALLGLGFVTRDDASHAPEHALEVGLPVLQSVLPPVAIVPMLVGAATAREMGEILDRLWGGQETLIVVSSDLSHFHPYESAWQRDSATADAIERGEWAALGPDDACGHLAIAGLLIQAQRRGLEAARLSLCNSGDTAGPPERVVGYGAWAFAAAGEIG